jgi:hypothetical protein
LRGSNFPLSTINPQLSTINLLMPAFDPNLPAANSPSSSAEMRGQLNALKDLIDAQAAVIADLSAQLATLLPVIARSAGGVWTLTYAGPPQDYWQVWTRYEGSAAWSKSGKLQTSDFPAPDADVVPDGTPWWQIKMCGEDGDGKPNTPFSNVISFGPVP